MSFPEADKLTIILPIRDRVQFTVRWLTYADTIRIPFKIIVADGGAGDTAGKMLADRNRFPNLDYEYIRNPHSKTVRDFIVRIDHALSRVKTPYVNFSADDDFPVIHGFNQAVAFLEAHPDYLSARGRIPEFTIADGNGQNAFGKPEFFFSGYFASPSRDKESALERIKQQCEHFSSNYMNVQRTEPAAERYALMARAGIQDNRLPDIIDDFLLLARGKAHHMETLFTLKQSNTIGGTHREILDGEPTLFDWMLRPSWSEECAMMVNWVSKAVSEQEGIPLDVAELRVKAVYYSLFLNTKIYEQTRETRWTMTDQYSYVIKQFMLKFLRIKFALRRANKIIRSFIEINRIKRSNEGDNLTIIADSCMNIPHDILAEFDILPA